MSERRNCHCGGDGFEGEGVGAEGIAADRCADAVGAEEGAEASEGFEKTIWVAHGSFEELKLLRLGGTGMRTEGEANDGGLGADGFEVIVQDAEEDFDVAGGRGNF